MTKAEMEIALRQARKDRDAAQNEALLARNALQVEKSSRIARGDVDLTRFAKNVLEHIGGWDVDESLLVHDLRMQAMRIQEGHR